jgi:hypothetical protein
MIEMRNFFYLVKFMDEEYYFRMTGSFFDSYLFTSRSYKALLSGMRIHRVPSGTVDKIEL